MTDFEAARRRSQLALALYTAAGDMEVSDTDVFMMLAAEVHSYARIVAERLGNAESEELHQEIADLTEEVNRKARDLTHLENLLQQAQHERDEALSERDAKRHATAQNAELQAQVERLTRVLDGIGKRFIDRGAPLPPKYAAKRIPAIGGHWSGIALNPGEYSEWLAEVERGA